VLSKRITTFIIAYLMLGLVFAICYALYYHWTPLAYFSPGFYAVIVTWPLQAFGLLKDIQYYGWAGKPL
jgi:hypothetical protein